MTVGELIAQLAKFDSNMEVVVGNWVLVGGRGDGGSPYLELSEGINVGQALLADSYADDLPLVPDDLQGKTALVIAGNPDWAGRFERALEDLEEDSGPGDDDE